LFIVYCLLFIHFEEAFALLLCSRALKESLLVNFKLAFVWLTQLLWQSFLPFEWHPGKYYSLLLNTIFDILPPSSWAYFVVGNSICYPW